MKITIILENIFKELSNYGVKLDRMNNKDLQLLKEYTDDLPHIVWINDHTTIEPVFINSRAKTYYGYTDAILKQLGFKLYEDLMHPDHFNDIHNTMNFFTNNPTGLFVYPYRVKGYDQQWHWTYTAAKPLNYEQNNPKYIFAIVFDIDELIGKHFFDNHQPIDKQFVTSNMHKYNGLSSREVEILKLIGQGYKGPEIAEVLHIEKSTVASHRNNLLQKLEAKNALDLVKYAILYHPDII